jgi:hypothetical protein
MAASTVIAAGLMPSVAAHAAATPRAASTIGTAPTEFYVSGGAGDPAAGGVTADYSGPTVTLSANSITVSVDNWTAVLAAPTGQTLATGTYSGAVQTATPTAPGIEVSGNSGQVCNPDFGAFTVYEVTATSFNATFKQSCNTATAPELVGFIRFNATQTTPVPTLPSSAHPITPPPNSGTTSANADEFHFVSSPNDFVGGGQTVDDVGSAESVTGNLARISVSADGPFGGWHLSLDAPTGEQLVPGTYTGATRLSGTTPGIEVTGDGRGCNQDFGTFTVYEIASDNHGTLTRLNATFSQTCESLNAAPLVGFIRFNATVPTPVPILPPPLVAALAPTTGTATPSGQTNVTLDASHSTGAGTGASYSFDFGDGAAPVVSATPTATKPEWQGTYKVAVTVTDTSGRTSTSTAQWLTVGAGYQPVSPTRLLDTRSGLGAPAGAVGAMHSVTLHLPPSITASGHGPLVAAVLNVTVTQPTAAGDIKVYSSGSVRQPATSNLNYTAGLTIANLVTVPLEPGDDVVLFVQSNGSAHLIADLEGYYTVGNDPTDSGFAGSMPVRIADTRHGIGNIGGRIPKFGRVALTVPSSVPAGATALAMNVTVVNAASGGYLTVAPDGAGVPKVSNINFGAGETLPNLAIVQIPADRKIDFYLGSAGSADLVVDLEGYYAPSAAAKFVPLFPIRLFDTRTGVTGGALPSGFVIRTSMAFGFGIPVSALTAGLYNVTVTQPGAGGYVSVFPDGVTSLPNVSNLNFVKNQTVPNAVLATMTDGRQLFYNGSGAPLQLIADFFGYFAKPLALDAPPTSGVTKRTQPTEMKWTK